MLSTVTVAGPDVAVVRGGRRCDRVMMGAGPLGIGLGVLMVSGHVMLTNRDLTDHQMTTSSIARTTGTARTVLAL